MATNSPKKANDTMVGKIGLVKSRLLSWGYTPLQDDNEKILMFKLHTGEGYMIPTNSGCFDYGQIFHIKFPKPSELPEKELIELAKDFDGAIRDFILEFILKTDKEKDSYGFQYYDNLYYSHSPKDFTGGVLELSNKFEDIMKGIKIEVPTLDVEPVTLADKTLNEASIIKLFNYCKMIIDYWFPKRDNFAVSEIFEEKITSFGINDTDITIEDIVYIYSAFQMWNDGTRLCEQYVNIGAENNNTIATIDMTMYRLAKMIDTYYNSLYAK